MKKIIAIDLYNQVITGEVTMTISGAASDSHHVPCVLIANSSGEGISGTLDSSYFKGQGNRK